MIKNILVIGVTALLTFAVLSPFGWTEKQTIGVSLLFGFTISILAGILTTLDEIKKKLK